MPRIPKYRRHSSRDRAFIEHNGRRRMLPGAFNSSESLDAYAELMKSIMAGETPDETNSGPRGTLRTPLKRLALEWLDYLERTGMESEHQHAKGLLSCILKCDANRPASRFTPSRLLATREIMVDLDWSRVYVNDQVNRLRRMFRWGVERELVPGNAWRDLQAVTGIRKGQTTAAEPRDVLPAPVRSVAMACARAGPTVEAMIRTQYRTGMRSHHLCSLTATNIEFDGYEGIWIYTPVRHEKGRGKELKIAIGPKTQRVLAPLLEDADRGPVFSPKRACLEAGRTPPPSVREHYDTNSYRQAVVRACDRAGVAPFHPHQLRHSAGTNARTKAGVEGAQAVLGHDRVDVTQLYAEKDLGVALEVARKMG